MLLRATTLAGLIAFASAASPARAQAQRRSLEVLDLDDGEIAYFVAPTVRRGAHPVFAYMHGRGAIPRRSCESFSRVAPDYGWLLCPAGWEHRGGETRGWGNDSYQSERALMRAVAKLRERFPGKVLQRRGLLAGFSEGAYVALQIGVRNPVRFPFLMIIGGTERYLGDDLRFLKRASRSSRVFLLTGEHDGVRDGTVRLKRTLRRNQVATRAWILPGIGHEIPDRFTRIARHALWWLTAPPGQRGPRREEPLPGRLAPETPGEPEALSSEPPTAASVAPPESP